MLNQAINAFQAGCWSRYILLTNSLNTRKMVQHTKSSASSCQQPKKKNLELQKKIHYKTYTTPIRHNPRRTWNYFNLNLLLRSKEKMLHQNTARNLRKTPKLHYSPENEMSALLNLRSLSVAAAHGWHAKWRHWRHPQPTHWRGRSKASTHTCSPSHSWHWWRRQSKRQ